MSEWAKWCEKSWSWDCGMEIANCIWKISLWLWKPPILCVCLLFSVDFFCSLSTVDGLLIVEHGAGWLAGTVDAIPQRKPTRFVCLLHRLLWLGLAWIGIIESLCSALHTNEEVASSRIHFVCLLCEIPKIHLQTNHYHFNCVRSFSLTLQTDLNAHPSSSWLW